MRTFLRCAVVIVCVAAGAAIGMTASAWASGGGPAKGPFPPAGAAPHAIDPSVLSLRPPIHVDSTFVPIAPCRIVDTLLAGGALGNGVTRTFYVGGTTNFTAQGGKPGGCGIPTNATAIAAMVTAPTPPEHGYLRAYPANQAEPNATVLSYLKGLSGDTGATIPIQAETAHSLKVTNHVGPTQLIIDVSGYYHQQMEGMISPTGTLYSGSDRMVSATRTATGEYDVVFDSDISDCSPMIDTYLGFVYGSAVAFDGTHVFVDTWRLDATTHVEVPENDYFYITVNC